MASVNIDDYLTKPTSTALDFSQWGPLLSQIFTSSDLNRQHAAQTLPALATSNLPQLQRVSNLVAEANARKSNQIERATNPTVARARELLGDRVLEDASEGPNQALSNLWTRMGLADSIATGADTGSGFARSALADATRSDYIADRDRRTAELSGYVGDNPRPTAGVDPSSAVTRFAGAIDTNRTNRDAYAQQQLGLEQGGISDLSNLLQELMQTAAGQKQYDAQAMRDYEQTKLEAAISAANQINSASATNKAGNSALLASGLGAGGAIIGAGLIAF